MLFCSAMHLRMLEAEKEATERAMRDEEQRLREQVSAHAHALVMKGVWVKESARREAEEREKERVARERDAIEHENRIRERRKLAVGCVACSFEHIDNQMQAEEHARLVEAERQRAERLEQSFRQLQV